MRFRPSLLRRFIFILTALCDVLAGRVACAENPAQVRLVLRWVRRVQARAEDLVRRLANGEDVQAKPFPRKEVWATPDPSDEPPAKVAPEDGAPEDGAPEDGEPQERPADIRPTPPRLPLQWGWMVRETTETLPFGTDLLYLLIKDEKMQAFLKAAPEIVPAVRHLLRLLAICPPDFLARTRRPRAAFRRARMSRPKPPPGAQPESPALPPLTGASFFPPLTLDLLKDSFASA